MTDIKLSSSWLAVIKDEFDRPYMKALREFLQFEKEQGKIIFPKNNEIFAALDTTAFDDVKVVILGQDPYHGESQAHGLSFSVRSGIRLPPSLLNIYKEIESEFDVKMPRDKGDLTSWARQGVLLLNATLTVEMAKAGSHQKRGWEEFTDRVIRELNDRHQNIVFLLWGSYAQKKGSFIDREKHLVLESVHPSPLSAHRGFFGCGHFKKANDYLAAHNRTVTEWWKI